MLFTSLSISMSSAHFIITDFIFASSDHCWNVETTLSLTPIWVILHLERYLTMIHHWQAPEMSYISSLVHLSRAFWQCCKANFSREYYSLNLLGKKKKNKLAYISTENYASNFTFNPWKNYLLQVTLTINCTLIL